MSKLSTLSALACAAWLITGCGGGGNAINDPIDDALTEDAQGRRSVAVVSHGSNPISIWGDIAFKTAGNVAGHDVVTTHLAMYDAVVAISRTHRPYAIRPTTSGAGGGAVAMNAAAVEAAYRVLKGLFPTGGANYEAPYAADMAALPDGADKSLGIAIGAEVATGMLALRANDGRATVLAPYVPGTLPGQFRGLNPVNRVAPYVKPFATLSHAQFRAPGPLVLTKRSYAAELEEVRVMASATSTQRTPEQTEIARFHTEPPNTFWARNLAQFSIAQSSLPDNARAAALIWTAWQDALSGCFESKYHYNFWRPISAIQLADTDGNHHTQPDPSWAPVVPTPNHPEYPAAHGCGSGAVAEAVRTVFGTRKVSFDFTSNVAGTNVHHYDRTEDLVREIENARVWGGMHFRSSVEGGAELGKHVAKWVAKHHFRPLDE